MWDHDSAYFDSILDNLCNLDRNAPHETTNNNTSTRIAAVGQHTIHELQGSNKCNVSPENNDRKQRLNIRTNETSHNADVGVNFVPDKHHEKYTNSGEEIQKLLKNIQSSLFDRAEKEMNDHLSVVER